MRLAAWSFGWVVELLCDFVAAACPRPMRMQAALAAGLAKHRVQLIIGIVRSTIDRRLQRAEGPSMGHLEAVMIT